MIMNLEVFHGKTQTIKGKTGREITLETAPITIAGKLSTVYRGTDYDGTSIASKVFHTANVDSDTRSYRFVRAANEAAMTKRAADIVPEGVIRFRRLDIDVATGRPVLVTKYEAAGTLAQRMYVQNGEISNRDAVRLLAGVAESVGMLNKNGIVHRDIKPDNVFVDYDDADFKGRLGDLSLALDMSVGDAISAEGYLFGTPRYLSPESMRGRGDSPPVDVWGLGVTTFTVLAGKYPFPHTDLRALFEIITHDVPVLRDVFGNSILDKGLRETIQSAMAIDPEDRPSATEFSYQLAQLAEDAAKAGVEEVPLPAIPKQETPEKDRTRGRVAVQVVFES